MIYASAYEYDCETNKHSDEIASASGDRIDVVLGELGAELARQQHDADTLEITVNLDLEEAAV